MDLTRIIILEQEGSHVIVLREREGERWFPILIGRSEAEAIHRRITGTSIARPMTHDLMSAMLEELGGELEQIVITELRDHTFFAKLVVRGPGGLLELDSRPSDAVALAAGTETPIFVDEQVLQEVC
jgi:bifunctional DNase/RNase